VTVPGRPLLLVVAWLVLGCAGILELEERQDAIERLCACDAQLPELQGGCREVLSARLDQVSRPTREAWLTFFAERCSGDDAVCVNAYDCYAQPGTCSPTSCASSAECCGYADGQRCFEGMCQACRADGAGCSDSDDCCNGSCNASVCGDAVPSN
jgi:hypothetical protein